MNTTTSNQCLICPNPVATGPGRTGKFCSRSCSATYTNTVRPKRQLTKSCKLCSNKIKSIRTYCDDCSRTKGLANKTIGALRSECVTHATAYNRIRIYSRNMAMKSENLHCVICGYANHVEVAHLTSLSELPDEMLVGEAGGANNYVLLCPNHHWEFDYGDLASSVI